jgi:hypothetical protein
VAGLSRGREVIWVPALLAPLFTVMKNLPRGVWRRVSAR